MARFSFHINFRAGDFDYGQNLKFFAHKYSTWQPPQYP